MCLATRVLALIGTATIMGGLHSLVVPVYLDREDTGFVIPEGKSAPLPEQHGQDNPAEPAEPSPRQEVNSDKVGLELAQSLHDKFLAGEPVLFLDARLEADYQAGRIMGALHMPHSRLSGGDGLDELAMFTSPGEGTLLVVYCTGGDCEASEDTAILLRASGYTNIAIMADGYADWVAAGLPVEGENPGGTP